MEKKEGLIRKILNLFNKLKEKIINLINRIRGKKTTTSPSVSNNSSTNKVVSNVPRVPSEVIEYWYKINDIHVKVRTIIKKEGITIDDIEKYIAEQERLYNDMINCKPKKSDSFVEIDTNTFTIQVQGSLLEINMFKKKLETYKLIQKGSDGKFDSKFEIGKYTAFIRSTTIFSKATDYILKYKSSVSVEAFLDFCYSNM